MPVRAIAQSASVREQKQPSRAQLVVPVARSFSVAIWRLRSPRARRPSKGRASLPFLAPLSLRAPTHERLACNGFQFIPLRASGAFEQALQPGRALLIGSAEFLSVGQVGRLQVVPVLGLRLSAALLGQACRWQTAFPGGLSQNPMANPSVKGTSCGKPQAAPYVER
jgi:hypothetical protein